MATLSLPIGSHNRFSGSVARLINMYFETQPRDAKAPVAINRIPGVSALGTFATSGFRGGVVWNEAAYAVVGANLYKVAEDGTTTSIGAIAGTSRCSLAAGTQLGINNNTGTAYTYDGSTLAAIADADFPSNSRGAAMLDDYMAVFKAGTHTWNSSDKSDFTAWDALAFDNAEGSDDDLVGIIAGQSKYYLGGSKSTEIYWNAGLSPFAFQRVPNGVIDFGLMAQHSQAIIDNTLCWLAHDGTVRILRGLTPQRISTHAVEAAIAGYNNTDQAFAIPMAIRGHNWYVLTFPAQGTWVYDFNTNEWHERESLGYDCWNVDGYLRAYNKDLAFYGDKVGVFDESVHDEWSSEIRGRWTYPAVYGEGRRAYHKRFEIRCEVGVGNADVTEPLLTLELSDDGGKTWTALPTRSLGKVGEYQKSLVWTRLGSSEDRVYRVSMSDPALLHIWRTELEADGGRLM